MQNMELVDGESIADDLRGWMAFFLKPKTVHHSLWQSLCSGQKVNEVQNPCGICHVALSLGHTWHRE
jgi:hypothetical protein